VSGARGQAKRFWNGLVGDYGRVVIADERHAKVSRHTDRLTPSPEQRDYRILTFTFGALMVERVQNRR
jgi:hypothetical protein